MILACQNIDKAFGTNVIVQNGSFHIEDREKAAIVGVNGAGKSTLLKMIIGEMAPDNGTVVLAKGKSIGYLAQHQEMHLDMTIYDALLEVKQDILALERRIRSLELQMKQVEGKELEELLETYHRCQADYESANGYAYKSEMTGVLKGLGFSEDDFTKKISDCSGGQKTRVALGKLLLTKPDVLLLDEPTNHLDVDAKDELKRALKEYKGSILMVCHEPDFYEGLATDVWDCSKWTTRL